MKKTRLVALGLGALSIAGLVGAGVGLSANNNVKADEVKAGSGVEYMHIWISSDNDQWIDANSTTKLGAWGGSVGEYTLFTADYTEKTDFTYYRFTVPSDITGLKAERYNPEGGEYWGWNTENMYTIQANSVYWAYWHKDWNKYVLSNPASVHDNQCSATMFAKAIEDIETCSSDSKTGYGAYENLKAYFYDKLKPEANLASVNVTDYSYTDYVNAGKTYSDISRSVSYTAQQKWDTITSLHNGTYFGPSLAKNADVANSYEPMTVVAGVSVGLGTVAAGSFLLIRKRKMM